MRLHVVQNAPFEGPGIIAEWAADRGFSMTTSLAPSGEFPPAEEFDFLVVLGGPMAADSDAENPWLTAEKHLIAESISAGHLVLGVCLGSQILAEVLGGSVRRNEHREIGWYAVEFTALGREERLFAKWPDTMVVGQWHGDTFDLPLGMAPAISSEACVNQAFVFDGRVVGLQFHLEWDAGALDTLVETCGADLGDGSLWVMSRSELLDEAPERIAFCRERLLELLDALAEIGPGRPGSAE